MSDPGDRLPLAGVQPLRYHANESILTFRGREWETSPDGLLRPVTILSALQTAQRLGVPGDVITRAERLKLNAFYFRLGRLAQKGETDRYEPTATWSRASQIARTWRSDLAWWLYNTLGYRGAPRKLSPKLAWKLSTMPSWAALARSKGAMCHVGRVNTKRRIALCGAAGASSFDGTSVVRFPVNLERLNRAVETARRQGAFELETGAVDDADRPRRP